MFHKTITFNRKVLEPLLIFCIFLLALALRFYNFSQRTDWHGGDGARDYIVAYQMAFHNENLLVGPTASGNNFYYPPYYYYFLSILIRINDSPLFMAGFFTVLHSLSAITIYFIGKKINGPLSGFVASLLWATSVGAVSLSLQFHGAVNALPFFLFATLGYFSGIKNKNNLLIIISFIFLGFSAAFSYVVLILFPLFLLYYYRHGNVNILTKVVVTLFCFFLLFDLLFPLLLYFKKDIIIRHFLSSSNISISQNFLMKILNIGSILVDKVAGFSDVRNKFSQIIAYGTLFSLYVVTQKKKMRFIGFPLLVIIWVIVLGLLRNGEFFAQWIDIPVIMLYLLVGIAVGRLCNTKALVVKLVTILATCCLLYFSVDRFLYLQWHDNNFYQYQKIAEYLMQNHGNPDKYIVYAFDENHSFWNSTRIWIWFLRKSEKIFTLVNYGVNIHPPNQSVYPWFFVCETKLTDNCRQDIFDYFTITELKQEKTIDSYTILSSN